MRRVDASSNAIGDGGACALALALPSNRTLTALNLRSNSIRASGARELAAALRHSSLLSLSLQSNDIGAGGAAALAQVLRMAVCPPAPPPSLRVAAPTRPPPGPPPGCLTTHLTPLTRPPTRLLTRLPSRLHSHANYATRLLKRMPHLSAGPIAQPSTYPIQLHLPIRRILIPHPTGAAV